MPDYNGIEPVCPFDLSMYRKRPAGTEATGRVDVKHILSLADGFYEKNDPESARELLERSFQEAYALNDKAGQLGIINELLGCYRKTQEAQKGLWAAQEGSRLISELGMEGTVTAGTVLLNAATTMREFGLSKDALRIYDAAARAYSTNLDPKDYRFAGLFNNYASCLEACGDRDSAEKYYLRALDIISRLPGCETEEALTLVNIACLYDEIDPEDERIEEYVRKAIDILNRDDIKRDGYYAFNVMKCVDAFEHFGFFRDARELRRKAEEIYGIL